MLGPTSKADSQKWAAPLRREMQKAIGQLLRDEYELPQPLTADLKALLTPSDTKNDPYADIVGTC